jgi:hypothetical protein
MSNNDSGVSERQTTDSIIDKRRRRLLALSGASVASVAGLAGCSGDGGGGGGDGDDGGGDGDDGGGDGGDGGMDLQGTELVYWAVCHANSEQARTRSEELIQQFQSDTGANINVSWESGGAAFGGEWRNQMSNENYPNYPVLYDSLMNFNGQFMAADFLEPFENYKQWLDDEVVNNMEMMVDVYSESLQIYGDQILEVPIGFLTQEPFIARTDHFEEAGLSWEDDFPPKDYDHLIDVATTLQNDGPADYGFPIYGTTSDALDEILPCYAYQIGGDDKGDFLTDEGNATNFGNDVWEQALQQYYDIQHKHELSFGGAPSAGDEDVMNQVIGGQASLGQINWLDVPALLNRAPDMMENGTLQFGPAWQGESGSRGAFMPWSIGIMKRPQNVDESEWEQKQKTAARFLNLWLSENQQKRMFTDFGLFPSREDVWDQVPSTPYKGPETLQTMAQDMDSTWSSHGRLIDIQYNKTGPIIQQMLNDELSAPEANSKLQDTVEQILSE